MVDEFPGNSNRNKPETPRTARTRPAAEPKKIERITKGEVIQRKPPRVRRFMNDARGVFGFVRNDVLIPAAKDMIADAGREALERMIFGETRPRSRGPMGGAIGRTRYDGFARPGGMANAAWRPANSDPRRDVSARGRSAHDFDEIILESRGEAEQVIDTLFDIVAEYQQASVSDLYELVGITPQYTDQKYGWTSMQGAGVQHARGGAYLLNLPKPQPLD